MRHSLILLITIMLGRERDGPARRRERAGPAAVTRPLFRDEALQAGLLRVRLNGAPRRTSETLLSNQ